MIHISSSLQLPFFAFTQTVNLRSAAQKIKTVIKKKQIQDNITTNNTNNTTSKCKDKFKDVKDGDPNRSE